MNVRPATLPYQDYRESQLQYDRKQSEHHRTASKPLNFKQAMSDFQFMFPEIDRHVIETVLRANNGVVQSTIDQLLMLQESVLRETSTNENENNFDCTDLPSYECSIGNGEEPPPAYSSVWEESPGKNRYESYSSVGVRNRRSLVANSYWKAPLVGPLPDDFLRIEVSGKSAIKSVRKNRAHGGFSIESSIISEDEKLAIFLQNEEFLAELRQNREFVSALEADHQRALTGFSDGVSRLDDVTAEPVSEVSTIASADTPDADPNVDVASSVLDDAAFKQKLKHMGKSTKKKFRKLAKKFSCGNVGSRNDIIHASDSTFNLLNDDENETYIEDTLGCINEIRDAEFSDDEYNHNYDSDELTNETINENIPHVFSAHSPEVNSIVKQSQIFENS